MSTSQLALLFGVAGLAMGAMIVAVWSAWYVGHRQPGAIDAARTVETAPSAADEAALEAPRPGVYERVVRVVAFLFIAGVGVAVAVTGSWPDTEVAVYLLLGAGTLFVVFMQDLLPAGLLGPSRQWLEASFAIGFLTVLVGLTGGLDSPFFLGYFLLVAGAALSIEGITPLLLGLLAGASYIIVCLLVAPADVSAQGFTWLAFNLVALALLAFIATVAGREQRRAREAALRLSRFDPLTGLYNRKHFFAAMEREIQRAARIGRGFGLLMLDLDDLKPVNDTFGHQYGDRLLRNVTEVIARTVRATDTAARYGGDEFVVLLPETDPEGAHVVAAKLRRDMAAMAIRVDERSVRTSVSVGLASYPEDGQTAEQLVAVVDAAMYEAKRRGKNQIVGYTTRTERVATPMSGDRPGPSRSRPVEQPRGTEPNGAESRGAEAPGGEPHGAEVHGEEPRITTSPHSSSDEPPRAWTSSRGIATAPPPATTRTTAPAPWERRPAGSDATSVVPPAQPTPGEEPPPWQTRTHPTATYGAAAGASSDRAYVALPMGDDEQAAISQPSPMPLRPPAPGDRTISPED